MISSLLGVALLCLNVLDTLKALKRPARRKRAAGEGGDVATTTRRRVSTATRTKLKDLLMLWVSWAFILHVIRLTDAYLQPILPFYGYLKMGIYGYLCLTRSFGGSILFRRILLPHLDRYSRPLDLSASLVLLLVRWATQLAVLVTVVPLERLRQRVFGIVTPDQDISIDSAIERPLTLPPSTPGRPVPPSPPSPPANATTASQKLLAYGRATPHSLSQALTEARAIFADIHQAQRETQKRGAELQGMRARARVEGSAQGRSRLATGAPQPAEDLEDRLRLDVVGKKVTGRTAAKSAVPSAAVRRAASKPAAQASAAMPDAARQGKRASAYRAEAQAARRGRSRAVAPPAPQARRLAVQPAHDGPSRVPATTTLYPKLPATDLSPSTLERLAPSTLLGPETAPGSATIPRSGAGPSPALASATSASPASTPSVPRAFRLDRGHSAQASRSSSGAGIVAQTHAVFRADSEQNHIASQGQQDTAATSSAPVIPSHAQSPRPVSPEPAQTNQVVSRKRKAPLNTSQEDVDRHSIAHGRAGGSGPAQKPATNHATSRNASLFNVTHKARPGDSGPGLERGASHPLIKRARIAARGAPGKSATAQTASRSAGRTLISGQTAAESGTVRKEGQTAQFAGLIVTQPPQHRAADAAGRKMGPANFRHSGSETSVVRNGGMDAAGTHSEPLALRGPIAHVANASPALLLSKDVSENASRKYAAVVDSEFPDRMVSKSDARASSSPGPPGVVQEATQDAALRIRHEAQPTPRKKQRIERLRGSGSPLGVATPRRSSRLAKRQ